MTKHTKPITDDALNELLTNIETPPVPEYFSHNVMQAIEALPSEDIVTKPSWWQWLALIGGGVPAIMQLATFVFSAWHIASVG
ncbi:hypothetical protein [Leucothrix arctica]|uniref:Uncharacterized protein n=1 Tax=Leucothrix arctica TaxID=1481894 RepID=A0A317C3D2_9GAMM|nr:hypothetical protein [Leucothrix arctica]PWQ93088.1 hypothetical protein DKT75_20575 [Leucothrix arctica]